MGSMVINGFRNICCRCAFFPTSLSMLNIRAHAAAQRVFKSDVTVLVEPDQFDSMKARIERLEGRVAALELQEDKSTVGKREWKPIAPFIPYIPDEDSPDRAEWDLAVIEASELCRTYPKVDVGDLFPELK